MSTTFDMTIQRVDSTPWSVTPADATYPRSLAALGQPPRRLWVAGALPSPVDRLIAVVGSRAVSRRGCREISDLSGELSGAGWVVISGGALGIDAAAHEGALLRSREARDAGGRTWAVLGCGIDVIYPDRHGSLFGRIRAGGGGLLSEYAPGTPPRAGQFPARNRLVAALASAILVGESRQTSGALITARLAARLGRPVFAIPGSPGTDGLIASGRASAIRSAAELREALAGKAGQVSSRPAEMEGLMQLFAGGSVGAAELAVRGGMALEKIMGMLSEAELEGWVVRRAGGKFEVNRGN